MAIDLSSLGLPKATITKSTAPQRPYRANAEKMASDLRAAKDAGEVRDLYEVSGITEAGARIERAADGQVHRISNYSSDVFFNREMPDQIDEDGGYTVGGVKFTAEELQQARAVLTTAARGISAGPGRNTNLDYRNYAQMAVAQQAVDVYAKGNLSEDQQRVVAGAMNEYCDALCDWQTAHLGDIPVTSGSEYYGRSHALSQAEADMVNSFKAELSRLTGRTFRETRAGDAAGSDQVATNKDLIGQLSSVLSGGDFTSAASRDKVLESYAQLVRPAYAAQCGAQNADAMARNDAASLSKLFDSILAKQHLPIHLSL